MHGWVGSAVGRDAQGASTSRQLAQYPDAFRRAGKNSEDLSLISSPVPGGRTGELGERGRRARQPWAYVGDWRKLSGDVGCEDE